jgi:hypothetical protein
MPPAREGQSASVIKGGRSKVPDRLSLSAPDLFSVQLKLWLEIALHGVSVDNSLSRGETTL